MRPDLHLHSACSDGVLPPLDLCREAAAAGVTVMAVTDHDTMAACRMLKGRQLPLTVIPGVELSLNDRDSLHLLGYGLTEADGLYSALNRLEQHRRDRAAAMLDKLAELGMPLDMQWILRRCGGTVGRPHIARAMVHAGYVSCMQEAFERYIGPGGPAYVPGERLNMRQALELLQGNGFIPVLAHPYELKLEEHQLLALVRTWQQQGLMGLEVYHPSAAAHGYTALEHMARRLGLLVTGGSDFHQPRDKHGAIGCTADAWTHAEEDVQALMQAMEDTKVCKG